MIQVTTTNPVDVYIRILALKHNESQILEQDVHDLYLNSNRKAQIEYYQLLHDG